MTDGPHANGMFDGGRLPGELPAAIRHKTVKAALGEVKPEDMAELLADAFAQRWGYSVGVATLQSAIEKLEARR